MEFITNALTLTHVLAGFSSLLLFGVPIFTRKGGINHRKIGRIYVRLMWLVVATALLLCVKNILIANYVMAAFLGFLSVITAKPLWLGVSVLKNKKQVSAKFRRGKLGFNLLLTLSGLALIAYGVSLKGQGVAVLMYVFGGLGVTSIIDVISHLRTPDAKVDWFKEHVGSMCTTGIAAYTAFFAFGASKFLGQLLSGAWTVVPWLAPTVIGLIGIQIANRRYDAIRNG